MDKIKIGKILKAQGIKGEMKVSSYLDFAEMFKGIEKIYIDEKEYEIETLRVMKEYPIIKLKAFKDRTELENSNVINKEIYALKKDIKLEDNRYFIQDLIGIKVFTEKGNCVGKIKDIFQFATVDTIVLSWEGKTGQFPYLNEVVKKVDIKEKKMIVDSKKFDEVVFYED